MPDLSLRTIPFHSTQISKIVNDNSTDTENAINNLQDQIDALATPPAGTEVTNARDYHTVLRDRLRSDSLGRGNVLVSGGVVTAQGSPNMTVAISAGEAVIGGIAVKWSGQNSGTITAPATGRYDVVVINSDSTISILSGNDSADKVLPDVSSTQKAVAVITLASATTSITNSLIRDCSEQGVHANGHYFWKIQDAVDSLNDRTNELDEGEIVVHKGNYYEEVVLTAFSNVTIRYENGSKHYRPSATKRCIKCINTAGNEETFIKIIGGKFYGNSKTGAIENLRFEYTDYLLIDGCFSDGNASASATGKDFCFKNCDNANIRNSIIDSREWVSNTLREDSGVMSIGSIQHWTDYLTGSVSLPYGWLHCDGSTISDAGSPLNGEALPDLEGDFRFLRGSGTSGTLQADQLQDHVHDYNRSYSFGSIDSYSATTGGALGTLQTTNPTSGNHGSETRPINMSVRMIMRVK